MENAITGISDIPNVSPEKRELLALEKENRYVFHGSGENLEFLEPRQAIDDSTGPDGIPGVFASNIADFAIFMAIMNTRNYSTGTISAGTREDDNGQVELDLAITQNILDELNDTSSGWVYVFNKSDFTPRAGRTAEFVRHKPVVPVKKIRVQRRDLPMNIKIREYMPMSGFEKSSAGESETDYKNFCGRHVIDIPSEKTDDPDKETQERRAGIKQLATIALNLPRNSSWADLTKAGGYDAYLRTVESLCKHKEPLDSGEKYVNAWAEREGVSLTKVSGLIMYRGKGTPGGPLVDEVLLSVTKNKAWSHQPFGGKRNPGEGAVAAMLREFGEEAGWEAAVQLLHSFKSTKAFYLGYYVQRLSPDKALLIQTFTMNGQYFDLDVGKFKSGSDSIGHVWAGRDFLEGERGKNVSLTEQSEKYMKAVFGFSRLPNKFTHPDETYAGVPLGRQKNEKSRAA